MTDEQINVAIAEACPSVCADDDYRFRDVDGVWHDGIPNFCNDLNAMHEACESLFGVSSAWEEYINILLKIRNVSWALHDDLTRLIEVHNATARQRAEAFLRTIGKWDDGE